MRWKRTSERLYGASELEFASRVERASEFLEVSHDSFHIVTLKIWAVGLNLERNGLTRVRRTVRVSSLASNVKCHRSEVNDRSPGNNP